MEGVKLEGQPEKHGTIKVFKIKEEFGTRGLRRKGLKAVLVRRSTSAVLLKQKAKVSHCFFNPKFLRAFGSYVSRVTRV